MLPGQLYKSTAWFSAETRSAEDTRLIRSGRNVVYRKAGCYGPNPRRPPERPITQARVMSKIALGLLLVAAYLAYSTHYLAAIKFAAAGIALPVLGRFFSSELALAVGGALVVAGIVFVIAWYVIEHQKKVAISTPVKP